MCTAVTNNTPLIDERPFVAIRVKIIPYNTVLHYDTFRIGMPRYNPPSQDTASADHKLSNAGLRYCTVSELPRKPFPAMRVTTDDKLSAMLL